jgi:cytochrome c-type biogenesis protein CcmF
VPLLLPLLAIMVIGPMLRWQQADLGAVLKQLKAAAGFALLALLVALYFLGYHSVLGAFAAMFGVWIIGGTLIDAGRHRQHWRHHLSRLLAHGGLGILVLGMAGSSFSQEFSFVIEPHQTVDVGAYHVTLDDIENVRGPNYQAARGLFHVIHDGQTFTLKPEQRYYPVQGTALSNVAIETNLMRDLYLALGEEQTNSQGHAARNVRFHVNPLVPWIWLGATIMALGGLTGLIDRRNRT